MSSDEINIVSLDDIEERSRSRNTINTCLTIDIACGGGIPMGCTAIMAGVSKSGKSSQSLYLASKAQQQFGSEVYFFNKERRLTQKLLKQVPGLDRSKFHVVEPPAKKDKAGNILGYDSWSSEQWLEHLGSVVQEGTKKVIIFDSISSMASEKQMSEETGYQDRGASNKIQTNWYQKYGDLVVPNEHLLILIAQGYANTSGYGPNFVMKIGNSFRYQSDLTMMVKKVEKWKPESNGSILGHDIHWTIEESPMGPPWVDCKVPLRYGVGIDEIKDTINHCIQWDIIEKNGAWYVLEKEKFQGESRLYQMLLADPDRAKALEKQVRDKIFGDTDD